MQALREASFSERKAAFVAFAAPDSGVQRVNTRILALHVLLLLEGLEGYISISALFFGDCQKSKS